MFLTFATAKVQQIFDLRKKRHKKTHPKMRFFEYSVISFPLLELVLTVECGLGCFAGSLDGSVLFGVVDSDLGEVCAALPPLCSPLARPYRIGSLSKNKYRAFFFSSDRRARES